MYLLALFVNEPDSAVLEQFGIARESVIWINLSSALPFMLIWLLGFYAFVKLRQYSKRIRDDSDGLGFHFISIGFGISAIGIPVVFVISRWMLNAINVDLIPTSVATIVSTYLVLFVTLVSFILIAVGAHKLYRSIESPSIALWRWISGGTALAMIGIIYTYFAFSNPSRNYPRTEGASSYFLPDWLILTTIVMPYLATLASAVTAVILMNIYRINVGGTLYRKAIGNINVGLIFSISALSISQFVEALGDTLVAQGFGAILALIYIMLLVLIIGNVLLARGAKRLSKFEEASDV